MPIEFTDEALNEMFPLTEEKNQVQFDPVDLDKMFGPTPMQDDTGGIVETIRENISPDAPTFLGRWAGNIGEVGKGIGDVISQAVVEIPETASNIGEAASILTDAALGPDQGPMTPKADVQADKQKQGERANKFLDELGDSVTGHGALAMSTGFENTTKRSMAALARLVDNDAANQWLTNDIADTQKFLEDATARNKTREVLGEKGSKIFEGALSSLGGQLPAMVMGQAAVLSQITANTFEEELAAGNDATDAAGHAVVEAGITFLMGKMAARAGARTMEEQLSPAMRAAGKLIAEKPSLKAMAAGIGGEAFEEGLINGIRQTLDINDEGKPDKKEFDLDEFFTAAATGAAAAGAAKVPSLGTNRPGMEVDSAIKSIPEGEMNDIVAAALKARETVQSGNLDTINKAIEAKDPEAFAEATGVQNASDQYMEAYAAAADAELKAKTSPGQVATLLKDEEGSQPLPAPKKAATTVQPDTKKDKVRQWFDRNFTASGQGNIYAMLKKATDDKVARVNAQVYEAQVNAKKAYDTIVEQSGGELSTQQRDLINQYMHGEDVEIPHEWKAPLNRMRAQIDNTSRDLLAEGVIDPDSDLGITIIENEGVWMNRTYRKHTDPNWMATILQDNQVVDDAKAYLREQYPDDTEVQIEEKILSLLDKDSAAAWSSPESGKAGTGFKGILKPREDIAVELRTLMGENLDPFINYSNSIAKIAKLHSHAQWIEEIKAIGTAAGFLSKPGDGIPQGYRQISSLHQPALAELNGYKASPEMVKALEAVTRPEFASGAWGFLTRLGSIPRQLIKYNPATVFRNTYGTPLFALSAGDLFSSDFRKAMANVKNMIQRSGENSDYIKRRIELGVLRPNVDMSYVSQMAGEWGTAPANDPLALQGQWLKNFDSKAGEFYSGPDNVVRLAAFDRNVAKYAQAYPNESLDAIEKMAAKDVADHYPDYTRHPEIVRKIGASPLIGDFVGFMYDGLRVTVNTARSIWEETRSDNPVIRDKGYSRLIGFSAATAFTPLVSEISQLFTGISDEEEERLARLDPAWDKNTPWLYLGRHEDGSPRRFNLSYIDPFGPLRKAMIAAFAAGEPVEAVEEIAEGWVREGMLTERVASIARNQTRYGGPVYNPEDTTYEKAKTIAAYMAVPVTPGIINAVKNVEAGLKGEPGKNGPRDVGTELAAVFGFKESPFSVSQAMEYRTYYYKKAFDDIERVAFKEVAAPENITPGRVVSNYRRAWDRYKGFIEDAHGDYMAAVALGADEGVVYEGLKKATSADVADQIVGNSPLPFYPSEVKIATIEERKNGGTRYKLLMDTISELEEEQASQE